MKIDLNKLPDDPELLKKFILQQSSQIDTKDARIASLEEFIRLEKHRRFGASSEKAPGQGELFDEAEAIE